MLHRIVEDQASSSPTRTITDTQEEYEFIEALIEGTKPEIEVTQHHYLIRTQFRYPLPVAAKYAARFRPPFFHRNVFYGCFEGITACYEAAFHWLRERIHVPNLSQTAEPRTHFETDFNDAFAINICGHRDVTQIMDKNDYSRSHRLIESNPNASSIIYPSCRDPQHRNCAAVLDVTTLGTQPQSMENLFFIYSSGAKSCLIEGPTMSPLEIPWTVVS
jgi:hypothetical protein